MRAQTRTKRSCLAGLVAIALLWAIPSAGTAQEQEVIEAGRQEFQRYCATCHGVGAKGNGPMVEFLVAKPADLTRLSKKHGGVFLYWRVYDKIEGSDEAIIRGHGTREMPIWGDVFRLESDASESHKAGVRGRILSLVHYLQSIQEE